MIKHFYNDIQGWFTFKDLYDLVLRKNSNGNHFVEVGVWKGTSAAYMATEIANSGKKIQFDCIDTWEGSEEHLNPEASAYEPNLIDNPNWLYEHFVENMKPVNSFYKAIKGYSLEIVHKYKDESLDFIFIDAAHDYNNVLADITAWHRKLKPDGIIAGHDYSWCDPVKKAAHDYFDPLNMKIQEACGCWIVNANIQYEEK